VSAEALPGFGFSGRLPAPIGPRAIAGLWDRLLRETLGYRRYIAQGGDFGSIVSAMAGFDHAVSKGGGCAAIHMNMLITRVEGDVETEADRSFEERFQPFMRDGRAYAETHRTQPQTLAFAMQDNPVGAAAWIVDKFHAWSDPRDAAGRDRSLGEVFGMDTLLSDVMFYVAPRSFATASWIYRAAQFEMRLLPKGSRIDVPTGLASFPREIRPLPPRALLEKTYQVERFSEFERGGHFASLEQPDLFVGDVAAFVKQVRGKVSA
jgi:pimeloyl-ACP methyl ester carboxylesterase